MSFQKILKKAKEIKKLLCIFKLSKNNNCAEVEIKYGGTRYTVLSGNQFPCDFRSLQMANHKTCHHIACLLLNLMQVGEENQLIAQLEIGHVALMQMLSKVPTEIPHHLSTIDNEDQNYDQMLMQHSWFNRTQTWYLGCKPAGTPCRCSSCLRPHKYSPKAMTYIYMCKGFCFFQRSKKLLIQSYGFVYRHDAIMGSLVQAIISSPYLTKKS